MLDVLNWFDGGGWWVRAGSAEGSAGGNESLFRFVFSRIFIDLYRFSSDFRVVWVGFFFFY